MPTRLGLLALILVLAGTGFVSAQSTNPFSAAMGVSTTSTAATSSTTSSLPSIFGSTMFNKPNTAPMMQKASVPIWNAARFFPSQPVSNLQNTMLGRTSGTSSPSQTLTWTPPTPRTPPCHTKSSGFASYLPWNPWR